MKKYEIVRQYDYKWPRLSAERVPKKAGYAVCRMHEDGFGFNKVYYSRFWILCFLEAHRLAKLEAHV